MAREIVTSENKAEYDNKKLGLKDNKILHPLSEKDFYKYYHSQHKDIQSKTNEDKDKTQESIMKLGFKKGNNVNTLPISKGGEPKNIIDKHYGNKAGDKVYLLPKSGVSLGKNGYFTKEGHIPSEHDIVNIEKDYEPTYSAYIRKYQKD